MMGNKARRFDPIDGLTLADLVPADHFYRHLERSLGLSFVRELVADSYAAGGRPSIDPVVFFKLQLVMFFEGIRSERQLLAVAADRLSVRWYLGYDLDEPLPDHSSLTRIRDRYGIAVFRRFFDAIVAQCHAGGLIWGQELFIDATKVAADAALHSLQPRFTVDAHLAQLFPQPLTDATDADVATEQARPGAETEPTLLYQGAERFPEEPDPATRGHDWLAAAGRPNREVVSGSYQRTADFRMSTTDPDASPMILADGRTHLGYQAHYVVDGGRARIILATLVAPAEVQENQPALDLLWRARFRWKLQPHQVTGDTKYATAENIAALERQGIRAPVPLSAVGHRPGLLRDTDFTYDPVDDVYRCPGRQR